MGVVNSFVKIGRKDMYLECGVGKVEWVKMLFIVLLFL